MQRLRELELSDHVTNSDNEDESSIEEVVTPSFDVFANDSSSSSSDEEEEGTFEPSVVAPFLTLAKPKPELNPEPPEEDIDAILASLPFSPPQTKKNNNPPPPPPPPLTPQQQLLKAALLVDPNSLDVETEQQSLYDSRATATAALDTNNKKKKKKSQRDQKIKQFYNHQFVDPSSSSFKHRTPNFVAGGFSFIQLPPSPSNNGIVAHYTFSQSTDSARLNTSHSYIISTGDTNLLAGFVADFPFYPPSILNLANIFAKFGEGGKCSILARRALQILEGASAFNKSWSARAEAEENPEGFHFHFIDYQTNPVNRSFFSAVYLHLRNACAIGCHSTASSVARYLLSCDFVSDPMGILLLFDFFMLRSGDENSLRSLVQLWKSGLNLGPPPSPLTINNLPNFAFSIGYALHLQAPSSPTAGVAEMVAAMASFPSILPLILEQNKVDVVSRSMLELDWPRVLGHQHFAEAASRPMCLGRNCSEIEKALRKMIDVYVDRASVVYKSDDALKFLFRCGLDLVERLGEGVGGVLDSIFEGVGEEEIECFLRYGRYGGGVGGEFDDDHFKEQPPMMPDFANMLDERFVQSVFDTQTINNPNRKKMMPKLQESVKAWEARNEQKGAMDEIRKALRLSGGGGLIGSNGHIDLEDPIVQVFLKSFLPWNEIEGV